MREWKGVPLEFNEKWRKIFNENQEILNLSIPCPICGEKRLYRFYHIDKAEHKEITGIKIIGSGSLWEWCRNCEHYEHLSAYIPDWWKCKIKVNASKLRPDPEYIDNIIASWGG